MKINRIAGALAASAIVAAGPLVAAGPAGAAAAPPQVTITPGAYFQYIGTVPGADPYQANPTYTVKWRVSAPAGICAESGRVVGENFGPTLASFDTHTAPFPTQMTYEESAYGVYSNGEPSPYVTVTVTDCAGKSDTASINLPNSIAQENHATYSPGWATGTCTCWSEKTIRKSTRNGQWVSYTGTFNGIALLSVQGPGRGDADIYMDGVFVKTIGTQSATTTNRYIAFQTHFAKEGRHTLKIKVVQGNRFDVDAFLTTYDLVGWGRPV